MDKTIITAAITGAVHVPSLSPYLPVTPEQIIADAVGAAEAGASVVHIHARNPQTGEPSSDLEIMRKIVTEINRQTDAVICVTTGASQLMTVEERLSPIPELQPELASCNAGSMNFVLSGMIAKLPDTALEWEAKYLLSTKQNIFSNTYGGMEQYIKTMRQYGTAIEFEVYDVGMINNLAYFKRQGLLKEPIYLQFVLGVQGGIPSSVENIVFLKNTADRQLEDYVWSVASAGRHQLPVAAAALAMGANIRVGLEDNLYIKPGILAKSSAEQVIAVRTIAELVGKEIATPDEVRQILKLKGKKKLGF